MKVYLTLMLLAIVAMMSSGCQYQRPSDAEIQARSNAYVACKTSTSVTLQTNDIKDVIISRLLDKMPGNDPCAEIITSGDKAQSAIAASNTDLGKKVVGGLTILGGIVADNLGDKWLADSVGKSAGTHVNGDSNTLVGGDQRIDPTTTTTTNTDSGNTELPAEMAGEAVQ